MSTSLMNSPSVRRSNSYRIALRKSGVPKEFIDELERTELTPPNGVSSELAHDTGHHNYQQHFIQSKSRASKNRGRRSNQLARKSAMARGATAISSLSDQDELDSSNGGGGEANKLVHVVELEREAEDDLHSPWQHLLCLVCCCNYCCGLVSHSRLKSTTDREAKV